jgi:hypothetical protein
MIYIMAQTNANTSNGTAVLQPVRKRNINVPRVHAPDFPAKNRFSMAGVGRGGIGLVGFPRLVRTFP